MNSFIEYNSLNSVQEKETDSKVNKLFWPWMAANVSFLAISYGSFVLSFKISLWQIVLATTFGTIFSFLKIGRAHV